MRGAGPERCRTRLTEHRDIARSQWRERSSQIRRVALDAITRGRSTFTDHDLARFVHRHSDDPEQFREAVSAVKASPELVALGRDGRGRERFTTRDMLEVEQRLERAGEALAGKAEHRVSAGELNQEEGAPAETRGLVLGTQQRDALAHITGGSDLALVVGYAGTGKSAMLGVARDAWEREGLTVRGAALSGIAAENLEAGAAIPSRTLASMEHGWGQGRDLLTSRDVLVIDEAGMIGSRQLERVLTAAEAAGAKVVLVGDPEQLQAIEAGAAFRALSERHGAAEITEVRRQREEWQRDATRQLATGGTEKALAAYEAAGMVHGHGGREGARAALVDGWAAELRANPKDTHVILAHTRADVAELNQLARERMRSSGALGVDVKVQTERGERDFAEGDRVMFLRNERSLGVKNGTLGTVVDLAAGGLQVRLDDGREVGVDLKAYGHVDHGYAATIHKAQGVTVDRAHVLATPGLDRHAAYVALSRHRDGVALHYGADDFADRSALDRTLGRERAKDTTLDYDGQDYAAAFAERREIYVPAELQRATGRDSAPERAPKRSAFAGLKLGTPAKAPEAERTSAPVPVPDRRAEELRQAVGGYVRAWADARRMAAQDLPVLLHQKAALEAAREALEGRSPDTAADLRTVLSRDPGVVRKGGDAVMGALAKEAEVRRSPELRAQRFLDDWARLDASRGQAAGTARTAALARVEARMRTMAQGLGRDPQVAALLGAQRQKLGLGRSSDAAGRTVGDELARSLDRRRSRGPER